MAAHRYKYGFYETYYILNIRLLNEDHYKEALLKIINQCDYIFCIHNIALFMIMKLWNHNLA